MMSVCVCACMYVCTYECMWFGGDTFGCDHSHLASGMLALWCENMWVPLYVRTYVCVYVCMYLCMNV